MKFSTQRKKQKKIAQRIEKDFSILDLQEDLENGFEGGKYRESSNLDLNIEEFDETEEYAQKIIAKNFREINEISSVVPKIIITPTSTEPIRIRVSMVKSSFKELKLQWS